ncbi:hypothetical protein QQP08_021873 [Theobroma cacao]|nr:hypothetical protein QQP08_021873 [Theobroma cacao]
MLPIFPPKAPHTFRSSPRRPGLCWPEQEETGRPILGPARRQRGDKARGQAKRASKIKKASRIPLLPVEEPREAKPCR